MSAPQALPIADPIPAARDIAYPGTMTLDVDATDIARGVYDVKQSVPVAGAGPLTLLYPEWLPGKHAPRGAIAELVDLKITAGGKAVKWVRDSYDVYAFHVDVPAGAKQLDLAFKFLTPLARNQGRIVMTPEMMNLQFEQVSLYPAGYYTRQIKVRPTITLPAGWSAATALDGAVTRANANGNRIAYGVTDYETLIDSPIFAGKHYRKWDLGQGVTLNVVADEAKNLGVPAEAIAQHRRLVAEAVAAFGARHFDHYEFLLALTDKLGGIGLEHHRSSENTREPDFFTDYANNENDRGLLPHELVHSWNGKFRRPAGLWTPDYRTPMKDNLLWVYEGQTSFWDLVLAARAGVQSKETVLADWARLAAYYSVQPGREWRSVEDTTLDPIIAARKAKPNASLSRGEDYYNEGSLTWLAADMKIRELTGGKKSLDDFARAFFGIRDGDWGQVTYDFDDVVATLNGVAPYDWASFLDTKLRQPGQPAPLEGITAGGYRLVWKDEPNVVDKARAKDSKGVDSTYSLGITVDKDGELSSVLWGSPAHRAGLVSGVEIVAVGDTAYSGERLTAAITAAKDAKTPVTLLTKRGDTYRTVEIAYRGGLRYPHLEKAVAGTAPLDRLLEPLVR
jgi:predicted metalloprotease with PDZ domain